MFFSLYFKSNLTKISQSNSFKFVFLAYDPPKRASASILFFLIKELRLSKTLCIDFSAAFFGLFAATTPFKNFIIKQTI